jgi:PKHD-type hydroxylase
VWLTNRDISLRWVIERISSYVYKINKDFFNFDIYGLTEDIQFTEYGPKGDHYKQHMDKVLYGVSRKLSIVVQLTDPKDYKGGELQLFEGGDPIVITKQQGMVTLFPSYMLHQVTPVTKGMRHTLVAWIGGKNFK